MLLSILPMINMEFAEDIIIPIALCVVLPVAIVAIVMSTSKHETDRKADLMLKAIEAGQPIPADLLAKKGRPLSKKETLLKKLNRGLICTGLGIAFILLGFVNDVPGPKHTPLTVGSILTAIGVGLIVSFFISKKFLKEELEAETKQNMEKE